MKNAVKLIIIGSVLILWGCSLKTDEAKVDMFFIPKDLPLPPTMGPLHVTWNSVGIDDDDNVYVVWGDEKGSVLKHKNTTGINYSDCVLAKFDTKTETHEIIASLADVLRAEDNWLEGEYVEKGHTPLPVANGKLYIGTMEFHSIEGTREFVTKEMEKYRGAHLLEYNIKSGEFKDVTRDMPGGVLFPKQGIIALDYLPEYNYIVAFSIPRGDIALYNTLSEKVDTIIPGPDEELGNLVYRNIMATSKGKIYFGFREFTDASRGTLYELDVNTFKTKRLMDMPGSVINGYVQSNDRKHIYIINQFCDVLHINVETEEIKNIGIMVPASIRNGIHENGEELRAFGLNISPDGKKLYTIPMKSNLVADDSPIGKFKENGKKYAGMVALGVYEFDIESRAASKIFNLSDKGFVEKFGGPYLGYIMGSEIFDKQGRFYMTQNSRPALIRVDVSDRLNQ